MSDNFNGGQDAGSQNWWEYQHGDIKYRSPNQLTDKQVQSFADHNIQTGLYDEQAMDKQELHRADLLKNQQLLNSYRTYYKAEHGKEFEGDDEAAIDSYYQTMRFMDSNTTVMATTAMKLQGNHYDPGQRIALRDMMSTWDRTASSFSEDAAQFQTLLENPGDFFRNLNLEASGGAILDHAAAQATDPINLLLIPFLGVGAKSLAGAAAKTALREIVKKEGLAAVLQTAKAGAIENGLQSMVQSGANQGARDAVGLQDGVDVGQQLLDTALGALSGGAFAGGAKAFGMATGAQAAIGDAVTGAKKGVMDALSETPAMQETPAAVAKKRFADRSARRNDLIQAEADYRKAVADNDDLTGSARKKFRDAQAANFATMLGNFSDKAHLDVSFKYNNEATAIHSLISGDNLVNFMDMAGVKFDDDFNTTFKKVTEFDPTRAMDSKVDMNVSARTQHQAVLLGLTNSAYDRLQSSKIAGAGNDDIIKLGENWVKGVRAVTQMQNEGGWSLRLAQQRTWMTFEETDWAKLTDLEKYDAIDKIRSQKDQNTAISGLNLAKEMMIAVGGNKKIVNMAEAMNSSFTLNLLSNIDTPIRNLLGGVKYVTDMLDTYVGAAYRGDKWSKEFTKAQAEHTLDMDNFMAVLDETLQTAMTSKSRMATSEYGDSGRGIKYGEIDFSSVLDGFRQGKLDLSSIALSLQKTELDYPNMSPEQKNMLAVKHVTAAIMKSVGERAMLTGDELITQMSTRTHLHANLFMDGIDKGMSKAGAKKYAIEEGNNLLKEHVKENVRVGADPSLWAKRSPIPSNVENSIKYAMGTKFQSELQGGVDIGSLGIWANHLKSPDYKMSDSSLLTMGKAAQSVIATHVVPFVRTPASIINYNLEHTPGMSYLSKDFRRIMTEGNPLEQSKAAGSVIMGAGMWAAAMNMAVQGQLTGAAPSEYNQAMIARGGSDGGKRKQPYTFGFNGKQYALKPFEPFFLPMKVMADVADIFKYAGPESGQHASAGVIMAYSRQFLDYPGLSGIKEGAQTLSKVLGDQNDRTVTKLGKALAKEMFVTVPTVGLLANFPEETHRESSDFLDEFKRGLPYFNQDLAYTRDPISGQIIKYPHSAILHVLPFGDVPKQAADNVNQELVNSRLSLPIVSSFFGGTAKDGGVDLKEYKGANGRPMYDRLQELSGQVKMTGGEFGGLTMYEALHTMITSEAYMNNTREEKWYQPLSDGAQPVTNQSAKQAALQFVIMEYRKEAAIQMEKEIKESARNGDTEAKRMLSDFEISKSVINHWAL